MKEDGLEDTVDDSLLYSRRGIIFQIVIRIIFSNDWSRDYYIYTCIANRKAIYVFPAAQLELFLTIDFRLISHCIYYYI